MGGQMWKLPVSVKQQRKNKADGPMVDNRQKDMKNAKIRNRLMTMACAAVLLFGSCGSSMERDAEKMAKRAIEFEQMQQRSQDRSNLFGKPMSREELEKATKEYIEFTNRMLSKYDETLEMHREFVDLVNKKIREKKND